jgi:hypothetical protein
VQVRRPDAGASSVKDAMAPGLPRHLHEAPSRSAREFRACHSAAPAPEAADQHRVFGRSVDPERVVERAHQAPCCRKASQINAGDAHAMAAPLADGHIGPSRQPWKDDMTAQR